MDHVPDRGDGRQAPAGSVAKGGLVAVLVIDDSSLYREGLADVLRRQKWCGPVWTAAHAEAALRCLRASSPHVVLLNMAAFGSSATLVAITDAAPEVPVVALGVTEAEEEVIACAEAGVGGYLLRGETLGDLRAVVECALRGETLCSPRVAGALLRRVATLAAEQHRWVAPAALTTREREILLLIDDGLSNKQIAQILSIEVRTVKNHVHNILEKLRVHRRGEAAARMRSARVPV